MVEGEARELRGGELALLHHQLGERLVARDLREATAAEQVGAAVADLGHEERVARERAHRRRRPHALEIAAAERGRVDAAPGLLHAGDEARPELARAREQAAGREDLADGLGGGAAGDLARGGVAHPVADAERHPLGRGDGEGRGAGAHAPAIAGARDEEAVLVVVAFAPDIGARGDVEVEVSRGAQDVRDAKGRLRGRVRVHGSQECI